MVTAVLGAPGSGKSTLVSLLAPLLPTYVVLDWDSLMIPAAALAGRNIRQHPETWPAYRQLVRAVVDSLAHLPVVLFTVCTPDELADWPIGSWILLDCTDQERRRRLGQQPRHVPPEVALRDAQEYRVLGLPAVDTACRSPEHAARSIAQLVAPDDDHRRR